MPRALLAIWQNKVNTNDIIPFTARGPRPARASPAIPLQPLDQLHYRPQIGRAKIGSTRADHDERVRFSHIGPASRQRLQFTGCGVVVNSVFAPSSVTVYEFETLADQRMERMGDLKDLCLNVP